MIKWLRCVNEDLKFCDTIKNQYHCIAKNLKKDREMLKIKINQVLKIALGLFLCL